MGRAEHHDVTCSGVRLRVSDAGAGHPVLLLHGLYLNRTTWDEVGAELARRHRVVAPDLPGFGDSEKPRPARYAYGIDAFTEAIADLYAGLALGRAAVVGHALGGAVALTLAARHPELVSELVLVDALCYPTAPDLRTRIALTPVLGGFVLKQLWSRATFRAFFRERVVSSQAKVSNRRIDAYYDSFTTPAARGSALATLKATLDTRAVIAHLSRIKPRTLIAWGRDDRIYPRSLGQRLAREIRGAGFTLLDAGHAPQEERPHELAEVIDAFLKGEASGGVEDPERAHG